MQSQRQPFFKPLNLDHQTHEKSKQASYEKVKQDQDYAVSGERLKSLHAKLHQEADRIRKWKESADIDIKQKDRKILESHQTIDALRKSLLEVQLQNENLSMKLQDEIGNREDIVQRVSATRHMCAVLKDHLRRAETRIDSCDTVKTELQESGDNQKLLFEDLTEKFKELQFTSNEQKNSLTAQLSETSQTNENLKAELEQQAEQAEAKLKALESRLDDKNIELQEIRGQIQKNNERIWEQQKTIESLIVEKSELEDKLSASNGQCESLCTELESVKSSKQEVEVLLTARDTRIDELVLSNTDLQGQLEANTQQHSDKIAALQTELDAQKNLLGQKHKKLQFLQLDLEKATTMLEDVKSSKDMLIMEKAELEQRVRDLEIQNVELLAQHEQNIASLGEMTAGFTELQAQLAVSQQEGQALVHQLNELRAQLMSVETERTSMDERLKIFESDITNKEAGITDLHKEIADKTQHISQLSQQLEQLQAVLHSEQASHEHTRSQLATAQADTHTSQKEVASRQKEIKKLEKEVQILSSKNTKLLEKLQEKEKIEEGLKQEIEDIQGMLELQKESNETLMEEKQMTDEALQGQLKTKEKTASDLEAKNKTLKTDITAKNKQIKELEKEIKSLKSKVTSSTKSAEGLHEEIARLQTDKAEMSDERDRVERTLQEQLDNMETLKQEAEQAQKKATALQALADKCVGEREAAIEECERKKMEMICIMDNYKTDSDQNVAQKTKEVEDLKAKLDTMKKKQNKKNDDTIVKLQNEIEVLRKTISESGHQMESLQKTYGEKENQLEKLAVANQKKDEELRGLQQQLEKVSIKTTVSKASTVVQTSPFPDKAGDRAHRASEKTGRLGDKAADKTAPQKASTRIPTPAGPRTPLLNSSIRNEFSAKTPRAVPATPQVLRTPIFNPKTPSRSILKMSSTNSASKKRRVVFAAKEGDEESNSGESYTFEMMDVEDEEQSSKDSKGMSSRVLLVQSPKVRTPESGTGRKQSSSGKQAPITPRAPPTDGESKRQKKSHKLVEDKDEILDDEQPLVDTAAKKKTKGLVARRAPAKTVGKFFKQSPKSKMAAFREKEKQKDDKHLSWFDNDDVFGFTNEA